MADLKNTIPAGGNAAPGAGASDKEDDEDDLDLGQPAPSNKERTEKAAPDKEAEEKETPAKPEADAEKNAEADEDDKELDTSVWGDAGDEVANSVLQTLQNSGVTTDEAKALLWDAVAAGDPSKVDRDKLVEKVGKAKATLIMAGIENVTSRNNAKIAEIQSIAHETAGGKDNWTKATAWANSKLDAADLAELRAMIDKGGKQAKFAVQDIVDRYNSDPKNTALTAGKKQVTPDGKSESKVEGITRRQYGEMLDKLHRTGGTEAQFNSLRARREAGKKQGI